MIFKYPNGEVEVGGGKPGTVRLRVGGLTDTTGSSIELQPASARAVAETLLRWAEAADAHVEQDKRQCAGCKVYFVRTGLVKERTPEKWATRYYCAPCWQAKTEAAVKTAQVIKGLLCYLCRERTPIPASSPRFIDPDYIEKNERPCEVCLDRMEKTDAQEAADV